MNRYQITDVAWTSVPQSMGSWITSVRITTRTCWTCSNVQVPPQTLWIRIFGRRTWESPLLVKTWGNSSLVKIWEVQHKYIILTEPYQNLDTLIYPLSLGTGQTILKKTIKYKSRKILCNVPWDYLCLRTPRTSYSNTYFTTYHIML